MSTPANPNSAMTYRDAGVDMEAGDALVERIKPFAKRTMRPEVMGGLGGFGALFELSKKYKEPVLVSGTDGVGTKLKLAFNLNKHDTIGQDLVAMSVNDILVQGAEPLFFLDYYATGQARQQRYRRCRHQGYRPRLQAGRLCTLVGGETAEMPGMYPARRFRSRRLLPLARWPRRSKLIDRHPDIAKGDVLIGAGRRMAVRIRTAIP